MGSPFPGMDPYLERHWLDVHQSLVTYARDALNRELPPDLLARTEERVLIDAGGETVRAVYPDVSVRERSSSGATGARGASPAAVLEPIMLELESEPRTEGYVVILDRAAGERLITVVEFLSASNKLAGDDRDAYRRKRRELIDGGVNVVEVDLVRQGSWRELLSPHILPRELETTYRATIRRAQHPGKVWVYPIQLRDRLQAIRIPLRATDEDVLLDLQQLVEQAYRNGRYERTDYGKPCEPPLAADDAAWAESLFRESGSRQSSV